MGTRAVLTYHSLDHGGSPISVAPERFRSQMEGLAADGIAVVPLAELLARSTGSDAVALTFDDGLASIATEAAPILRSLGFPATVFVVPDRIGRDNRWREEGDPGIPRFPTLDWDALERLHAAGWEIGSHSRSHAHLSRCGEGELADEIGGCADRITRRLGIEPRAFAYPYGETSPSAVAATRSVYRMGCTTEHRLLGGTVDPALVPRLDAWYFRNEPRIRGWGTMGFACRVAIRHRMRQLRRLVARGPQAPAPITGISA